MGLWATVKDLLGEKQEKPPIEEPPSNSSDPLPFSLQDLRRRARDSQLLLRAQWICDSKKVLRTQETPGTISATIQSQSERNKKYEVTLTQDLTGTCECPAWVESPDRFCKHMAAVALFVLHRNAPIPPSVRSRNHPKSANIRVQTRGIFARPITDTPLAVIDFETTGLSAGVDRVVEVSIVRIEPRQAPRLVLDTLVNPNRRVAATEIHGITDNDVKDAPRFEDIAGDVARALSDCVVGAYNVYFDIGFLDYELRVMSL